MPTFYYKARDNQGKIITGTVEAGSENAAATVVSGRGWVPTSIVEKSKIMDFGSILSSVRGVSSASRTVFTRQLATMVTAGLPLSQSLDILNKQEPDSKMKEIIGQLFRDVESGNTLNQGLSKFPDVFSRVYVNLVKAGEASGSLDKILTRLADTEEKMRDFMARVRGAFIYPIIVVVVMVIVFIVMMIFVVPKLTGMYRDLGADLPLPTQVLIGLSDVFTKQFYIPLGLFVLAVVLYRYFSSTQSGIRKIAELQFKTPVFGKLRKQSELTEFSRTLSLLISAGIPILDALGIVSDAIDDPIYRDSLKDAAKQVERGVSLSTPLKADPHFPPILSQMVAVGEETGKLDEVLMKVSNFFESETEIALKGLTSALEPMIMIFLGVLVAALVVSIILPIYKLTSSF
jgi:type IV pilus assembly protein PilC